MTQSTYTRSINNPSYVFSTLARLCLRSPFMAVSHFLLLKPVWPFNSFRSTGDFSFRSFITSFSSSVSSISEASTWGLYTLIRSKIEKNLTLESLHRTLNLPFRDLTPDPGLKDTYDSHYSRYLELGNALSQLKF